MSEYEWLMFFSDSLYELMKERKISQRELAERTGLTERAISKYINGTIIPKATSIVKLAIALDCTTDDLINFDEMIEI